MAKRLRGTTFMAGHRVIPYTPPQMAAHLFIGSFDKTLRRNYDYMLAGNKDPIPVPMTKEQFAQYISPTLTHEIGHRLGLVDPDYFEAIEDGRQRYHNKVKTWVRIMDAGGLFYVGHRINPHPTNYWLPDNLRYLRFVLPKGE